jgi:hypothetical protein
MYKLKKYEMYVGNYLIALQKEQKQKRNNVL